MLNIYKCAILLSVAAQCSSRVLGVQVINCSDAQVFRCSGVQARCKVFRISSVQVFGQVLGVQVIRCSGVYLFRCAGVQVIICSGVQVSCSGV